MTDRVNLLGIEIDNVVLHEALQRIDLLIRSGAHHFVVTPNVDHLVKLQKDAEFRKIYEDASLVLADGQPLIWASRFIGTPLRQKVSGSDLFPLLCLKSADMGYKLFFLGGRPEAAHVAAKKFMEQRPHIKIVGVYCPPYHFEHDPAENGRIVRMIRTSRPDIVFVGLGAPKQEKWIHTHIREYRAPVSIGIGASFEFVSETVRRAPSWMQHIGLEWAWRLIKEPRRLWKRYLVDDMIFFRLVLKQWRARVRPSN